MKKAIASILFISMLLNVSTALSQSLVEQIKARASEISELKALLNSPDSAVRIAAIDVMQNSQDLAMREMGFNAGINSSDEGIVALSLRNKFKEIKNFNVVLTLPTDASEQVKKSFAKLGGQVSFDISAYDTDTATFTNETSYYGAKHTSSIAGVVLNLRSRYTNGTFRLNDELIFIGELSFEGTRFQGKIQFI